MVAWLLLTRARRLCTTPRPGWAYFRPQEIWDTTVAALRDAITQVEDPQRIAGLAVASMGESGVPIDAGGVELYDAIAWFDNRTEPQTRWLDEHIGSERIWSISGSTPQALFGFAETHVAAGTRAGRAGARDDLAAHVRLYRLASHGRGGH
jgi:sugar (pentulose or hexulose) kinase